MKRKNEAKILWIFVSLTLFLFLPIYGIAREEASDQIIREQRIEVSSEKEVEVDSDQDYDGSEDGRVEYEIIDSDIDGDGINTIDGVKLDGDINREEVKAEDQEAREKEAEDAFLKIEGVEGESRQDSNEEEGIPEDGEADRMMDIGSDDDGNGIDLIDEDEIAPAQDYNTVRSNKRRSRSLVIDREEEDPIVLDQINAVCGMDKSAALDEDGSIYCWGRGFSVKSGTGSGGGKVSVADINFENVRDWSEEEKDSLRDFSRSVSETREEGRLAEVVSENMENSRVRRINIENGNGSVRYMARMRLFGFIPLEREIEAVIENGREKINYPWYGFLSRKPDTGSIRSILSGLRDLI